MNKIHFKAFLLAVVTLVAACANQPNSQREIIKPFDETKPPAVESYDLTKGASPGLSYRYTSLEDLIKEVDALGGPQKDFETDAAFMQRMARLGPFTTCSMLSKAHIRFNSSTGETGFEYGLFTTSSWSESKDVKSNNKSYPTTFIGQIVTDLGKLEAQNSFGAKTIVSTKKIDNIQIVMNPIEPTSTDFFPSPKLVGVAKPNLLNDLEADKKVEICFEVVPIKPYVQINYHDKKPTLESPTATLVESRYIRVAVTSFYIKGKMPQFEYVEDLRFSR